MTSTPAPAPALAPAPPARQPYLVAPYLYVGPKYKDQAAASGHDTFTLAFITGFRGGKAVWDSGMAPDPAWCASRKVILSFGGAGAHTNELAGSITDVDDLAKAYLSIAKAFKCTTLDFDVEGTSIRDGKAIDRRNAALARLQKTDPTIRVNYTLPVMPSGLDGAGLAVMKSAKKHSVAVGVCNLMTMDWGIRERNMGAACIKAATSTRKQLVDAGMSSVKVGVTPMIGTNDTPGEVLSLKDAVQVRDFCAATPWVGLVAYWSLNRDNGKVVSSKAAFEQSGVVQKPHEFLGIFKAGNK